MATCMVTGSFDPFTLGHLDLVRRVSGIFDRVYVAVLVNPSKEYLFSVEHRIQIIQAAVAEYDNVQCVSYAGMTYELAKELGVDFLVRGIRSTVDFEYELDMADYNLHEGGVDTLCLMTNQLADVSSGAVRECLLRGEPLEGLLPEQCIGLVKELYATKLR